MGYVYLIHFAEPYRHARHYMGWTSRSVKQRVAEHREGRGALLMQAVTQAGIEWRVVRTWRGNRSTELRFKQRNPKSEHRAGARNGLAERCPMCRPNRQFTDGHVWKRRLGS